MPTESPTKPEPFPFERFDGLARRVKVLQSQRLTKEESKMSNEKVTKLEAARRQIETAIELWINDGDAVSIHTLGGARAQPR